MTISDKQQITISKETLSFQLTALKDDDKPIFISGSFNNWNVADP